METIRINQEDINDLIAQKIFKDREELFNAIEFEINNGNKICFYSSYIIDDNYPIICFEKIDEFKIWRAGLLEKYDNLKHIFKNYWNIKK